MPSIKELRLGATTATVAPVAGPKAGAIQKSRARKTGGTAKSISTGTASVHRAIGKLYSETPWISSLASALRLPKPAIKFANQTPVIQQGTLY